MIPKRIGIISLLDGILVVFACSVDVSMTLLLEVCVVVVCIGILLSSGFSVISRLSVLCGDDLGFSLADGTVVTMGPLDNDEQVFSDADVHM